MLTLSAPARNGSTAGLPETSPNTWLKFVLHDTRLSSQQKAAAFVVGSHVEHDGLVRLNIDDIAGMTNCHRDTAFTIMRRLIDLGLIERVSNGRGRPCDYRLRLPAIGGAA